MMKDGNFTAPTESGLVVAMESTAVGSNIIAKKAVTLANEHEHTLNTNIHFLLLFIDFFYCIIMIISKRKNISFYSM